MNVISFLRDIGKSLYISFFHIGVHFRLGRMLSRESVKGRMGVGIGSEDGGMSFTEFTY